MNDFHPESYDYGFEDGFHEAEQEYQAELKKANKEILDLRFELDEANKQIFELEFEIKKLMEMITNEFSA